MTDLLFVAKLGSICLAIMPFPVVGTAKVGLTIAQMKVARITISAENSFAITHVANKKRTIYLTGINLKEHCSNCLDVCCRLTDEQKWIQCNLYISAVQQQQRVMDMIWHWWPGGRNRAVHWAFQARR